MADRDGQFPGQRRVGRRSHWPRPQQFGGWTYGLLFNHPWSYAGDYYRPFVSSTFLQPFVSYTTKSKTTFALNTESIYDWHNDHWTVPINASISQLTKIGKLPISFALGAKVYSEGPSGGPDWVFVLSSRRFF